MEPILAEWEAFAATYLKSAKRMESLPLRDHAPQILAAIAEDLRTAQTTQVQTAKSKGQAPVVFGAPETAAQTHAILRAESGFDINELASEYRALRASVLRLWSTSSVSDSVDFEDLIRFNEAVDQALAESVAFFHTKVEQSRNLVLGMLGHDLRTPLHTIQMTSTYLVALNAGEKVSLAAGRLMRSGARMKALLDDLLDFNRSNLGLGIAIDPSHCDMAALFQDEIDELRTAFPGRTIDLTIVGNPMGVWDGRRLQQVLANLVTNALDYGTPNTTVRVQMRADATALRFKVINSGPCLDQSTLGFIFEPMKRAAKRKAGDGNLGLGLYIVREIVKAHNGEVQVSSTEKETIFAVWLPRNVKASVTF